MTNPDGLKQQLKIPERGWPVQRVDAQRDIFWQKILSEHMYPPEHLDYKEYYLHDQYQEPPYQFFWDALVENIQQRVIQKLKAENPRVDYDAIASKLWYEMKQPGNLDHIAHIRFNFGEAGSNSPAQQQVMNECINEAAEMLKAIGMQEIHPNALKRDQQHGFKLCKDKRANKPVELFIELDEYELRHLVEKRIKELYQEKKQRLS